MFRKGNFHGCEKAVHFIVNEPHTGGKLNGLTVAFFSTGKGFRHGNNQAVKALRRLYHRFKVNRIIVNRCRGFRFPIMVPEIQTTVEKKSVSMV